MNRSEGLPDTMEKRSPAQTGLRRFPLGSAVQSAMDGGPRQVRQMNLSQDQLGLIKERSPYESRSNEPLDPTLGPFQSAMAACLYGEEERMALS